MLVRGQPQALPQPCPPRVVQACPAMGSTPRLTRHVRDRFDSLDNLVAAGDLVQGLLGHPGWSHVLAVIDAEINVIDRHLDGATEPLSQAEYAALHGRRGGLRAIEDAAHAIVRVAGEELEKQRNRHEGAGETALEVT